MKITISNSHLFEGMEEEILGQLDIPASANKFIELATIALKKEYPDVEIDSANLYHGDKVTDNNGEEDFEETQWVREITSKVYENWEWLINKVA